MKTRIEIDTRTLIRFWLVPLGIVVTGMLIYAAQTALLMLGIAFFFALAINPLVNIISSKLPGNSRIGGIALSFGLVAVAITIVITLVIPPMIQQTARFVETIPSLVSQVADQSQGFEDLVEKYNLQEQVHQATESAKSNLTSWAASVGGNILGSLSSVLSFVFASFLVFVLSFLMLLEGPTLLDKLWKLYRDKERRDTHRALVSRMYTVVTGYVIGQLTVALIGAVIVGLTVFVLSLIFPIPSNLALPSAAIYMLFTLIPMFGSTIAAIIIGFLIILSDFWAVVTFVILYLIYQQIENNIISPSIQSKHMKLSALWVLAAVTIGLYMFGLIGGLISIPIAGCLKILFDDYIAGTDASPKTGKKKPLIRLARKS